MSTLEIDSLTKRYGDNLALDNLSFTVPAGSLYGFVGSNGAGKSTCMRIALGVLEADSGEVRVDGRPVDDAVRRTIGYMPEERGLYDKEPIGEQLAYLARLHGVGKQAAQANTEALLERLGLAERAGDKLNTLSLGNQQRVQLAAALVHDPEILVLDEPFSGLDPVAVDVMAELLREYAERGAPVVFSSHQLDLVQRLCDRIVIITDGRRRAEGTVAELRDAGPVLFEVTVGAPPIDDAAPAPAGGSVPVGAATDAAPGAAKPAWLPEGCRLVERHGDTLLVEVDSAARDQELLRAALGAGPVHSFTRHRPDLTELFREVVA
ncbi:ABC transporter ATP-binding protein [Corynebacterium frankenforstense]|uniref:ABC transporter ATP-binding protein n=1 Tax=Corynebacterium frankenforstense TaxID=1230998 RepID=UPI0026F0D1EC|nr:ATP-binding cassette domain-containing protein [Corynebacterium frankenforstense]